jgi:glycosyltransferase involved in cell wall biosynthesis
MRILAVADVWFPDRAGGSGRIAAEVAAQLARRGHEVTVLAPRAQGQPSRTVEGTLTTLRTLPRNALPQTLTDVVATARQSRRLGKPGFDVVVGHQVTNAAGLALARLGAPLVLVYHASAPREVRLLRATLSHGWRRASTHGLEAALAALERFAVARAAGVIVLSEYSASLVSADHPAAGPRVRQVPGGVDADLFSPADGQAAARGRLGLGPDRRLLLVVRRLEHRLGLEDVLVAIGQLDDADLAVAFAGTGALAGSLERLAHRLGLGATVRFLGAPAQAELADWYRAADAVVLPPAPHEGFGLATIEAFASGTPVVASPVGATPELLLPLEPRLVAREPGPAALAEAIGTVLEISDPELRRRCRDYALHRFSWEAVIGEWERALLEAARSGQLQQLRQRPLATPTAR